MTYIIYALLALIGAFCLAVTLCAAFKAGEKEDICNYRYIEEDGEK